ncbi:hypothetical protein GSI_09863 [Ganoderma sinense ZZ0214-1]|uniref:Uncharacterized protein n=1 Tax=Ganoderma sinense ZZ0214-1 TaxID=1077348 RepID=A0A2G8S2N5_9APHY|nr:hypothetical protein GSI_09863 [Ganoderma sinense ZZ0214-1]
MSALPNLRELHGRFVISRPQVMDMRCAFPALQEISTQDTDQQTRGCFLAVLPLISSRSLTRLSLRISVPLAEDMVKYLDELCSSPATAQLRTLDLSVDIEFNQFDNQWEPFEGVSFASDVLAPLKRLSSALTDVSAVVCFQTSTVATFTIADGDLDAAARAWPGLARAKFGYTIEFDDSHDGAWGIVRPSLSAVVALAERCRALERVDVEFESVGAGELARLEARADACTEPQTALRRIVFDPDSDFCDTFCVEDPVRLAEALGRLFPNLRSGLEMVETEPEGETTVAYRGWHRSRMDTDAFWLLKALDECSLFYNVM